jgi:DNA topoisomerase-1
MATDTALGNDPTTGEPIALKKGPYGHYLQLGEGSNGTKPKRVALLKGTDPAAMTLDTAARLLALPREIGRHPESGEAISAGIGRFGAYLKHGGAFTSLGGDDDVLTIGLNRAVTVLAEAKTGQRRGPQLLRELGDHPDGGKIGIYRGRYGPYASTGAVLASLPRTADPELFSRDEAIALLATKGKATRGGGRRTAARAAPAAKAAAKNVPAAKTAAKTKRAAKPAARKPAAKGRAAKPNSPRA